MTVFVNDTFTDADGVLLENHTPETGGSWTKRSGGGDPNIQSNELVGGSSYSYSTNGATPGSNEYDVVATWVGYNDRIGLLGRYQDASNWYLGLHRTTNTYQLSKLVLGVYTVLDSLVEAAPGLPVEMKLEIRNATKKLYIASVEKLSSADDTLTAAALAGLYSRSSGDIFDNFSGDDEGAAPPSENAFMTPMKVWWAR